MMLSQCNHNELQSGIGRSSQGPWKGLISVFLNNKNLHAKIVLSNSNVLIKQIKLFLFLSHLFGTCRCFHLAIACETHWERFFWWGILDYFINSINESWNQINQQFIYISQVLLNRFTCGFSPMISIYTVFKQILWLKLMKDLFCTLPWPHDPTTYFQSLLKSQILCQKCHIVKDKAYSF